MSNYHKVSVTALVVTYGVFFLVKQIRDEEEDTYVSYPHGLITLEQITEAAIMLYKDDKHIGRVVRDYQNGLDVTLDGYAGQLPSVGGVTVKIETKLLDWI